MSVLRTGNKPESIPPLRNGLNSLSDDESGGNEKGEISTSKKISNVAAPKIKHTSASTSPVKISDFDARSSNCDTAKALQEHAIHSSKRRSKKIREKEGEKLEEARPTSPRTTSPPRQYHLAKEGFSPIKDIQYFPWNDPEEPESPRPGAEEKQLKGILKKPAEQRERKRRKRVATEPPKENDFEDDEVDITELPSPEVKKGSGSMPNLYPDESKAPAEEKLGRIKSSRHNKNNKEGRVARFMHKFKRTEKATVVPVLNPLVAPKPNRKKKRSGTKTTQVSPHPRTDAHRMVREFNQRKIRFNIGFDLTFPIRDIMPTDIDTFVGNYINENIENKPVIVFNGKELVITKLKKTTTIERKKEFLTWFIAHFEEVFSLVGATTLPPKVQAQLYYNSSMRYRKELMDLLLNCFKALHVKPEMTDLEKTQELIMQGNQLIETQPSFATRKYSGLWSTMCKWLRAYSLQIWMKLEEKVYVVPETEAAGKTEILIELYEKYSWRKKIKGQIPLSCFLNSFSFNAFYHVINKIKEDSPNLFSDKKSADKKLEYCFYEDNTFRDFEVFVRDKTGIFTTTHKRRFFLRDKEKSLCGTLEVQWPLQGTFEGKSFCGDPEIFFKYADDVPEKVQLEIARLLLNLDEVHLEGGSRSF